MKSLLVNEKVDCNAIPEPVSYSEDYVSPRNAVEKAIADSFKEVLNLDNEVSIKSKFFSLGGDSIGSIDLVDLLSKKGYKLSVTAVMKLQTPECLATVAVTINDDETYTPKSPIKKRYPLTAMQEAMLLKYLSDKDSYGYRLVSRYKLNIIPTKSQFREALDAIAQEHETIRTSIIYKNVITPEQEITERKIPLVFVDIRNTNKTSEDIQAEQLNVGFDLQDDPLMRVVCIITSENECQLLIVIHHIITDGWSLPIFIGHFFQHLKEIIEGKEIEIIKIDDGKFEQYVRSLKHRDNIAGLHYWKNLLKGYESKAEIAPYNIGAHEEKVKVNDHLKVALDFFQTQKLKNVCSAHGVTLSHVAELTWGIVLQRYSRRNDVVFAKVVSCRDKAPADMNNVVGPFINSIPVRVKAEQNETLSDALHSIAHQAAESNAYDYCSLFEIQQQSTLGGNLFQSILVFENYPLSDKFRKQVEDSESILQIEKMDHKSGSFNDITLTAYEQKGQLCLGLIFDRNKFMEFEMKNLLSAWRNVIIQLAKNPQAAIYQVSLISISEEQCQIKLGSGAALNYDKSETIIKLFKNQVKKTPNNTAVVFLNKLITYKELDDVTDCLAVKLHSLGVASEVPVGVLIKRSELMVVFPLAIMKAGGAYVPLDPSFPESRLLYMCKDTGISLILSDDGLALNVIPSFQGDILDSSIFETLTNVDEEKLRHLPVATPDNKFVILYTSGSTGNPKGVILEHHNIVNFCHWYVKEHKVTAEDNTIAISSFGFDAHMMDIYPSLICGASVHIIPEEMRKDINVLNAYMEEHCVSIAFMTTQLGYLFATTIENRSLRLLSVSGEKLLPFKKPRYRMCNAGAPTECTIFAFNYNITEEYYNLPIIGAPIANVNIYLVDSSMHLVPQGAPGEMIISGQGVGRGYLNLPEQNAEHYITFLGRRAYRTGDLCRWNADGQLEYIGRIDNQVKLRGYRIELGEIESVALQAEGIQQAVAMVRNEQIVLYYTGSVSLDASSFVSLPEYMIPSCYVRIDSMPLTPNGKIDRKALPEPEYKEENIVLPATKTEQQVLEIVEETMRISPISVTSNLISLGLSSITAMRLSMRLSKDLDRSISMSQLMSAPSIRAIASIFQEPIVPEPHILYTTHLHQDLYPLTENQLLIFLSWEKKRDSTQYNIPVAWFIQSFEIENYIRALKQVVNAHPHLKARVFQKDGELFQRRLDNEDVEIDVIHTDFIISKEFIQKRVRPYNLLEEKLYRIEIFISSTNPEIACIYVDFHHIVSDGLSNLIFIRDLKFALSGIAIESESYTAYDFALDEKAISLSKYYIEAEEWFDTLLAGKEMTIFPYSIEGVNGSGLAYLSKYIDIGDIDNFCKIHSLTQSNYFLSALIYLLSEVTREDNILITTINNGRGDSCMMNTMGMFVKTLPVVVDERVFLWSDSPAKVIRAIQIQQLQAQCYDFYPFSKMAERHSLRSQIMYEYQEGITDTSEIDELGKTIHLSLDYAKLPLTVSVDRGGPNGEYRVLIRYDKALYSNEDIDNFLKIFSVIAEKMPHAKKICDIPLLNDIDTAKIIALGSGPSLNIDITYTFVRAFKECADRNPNNIAIIDNNGSYTYSELDEASNILAHILIEKGVLKNSFVAIMLDRTWFFPLSVIAVHKVGAAYVPLDTSYPLGRLQYMIDDSRADILLTTRQDYEDKFCGVFSLAIKELKVVFVDDIDFKVQTSPIDLSSPEGNAYMIYTSGSTGHPKGVVLHQAGLWNFIASIRSIYGHTEKDKIASHRSFSYAAHVEDIFIILTVGGSLHIMPNAIRKDPQKIYEFLLSHKITGCGFIASMTKLLLGSFDLPLRYITGGGEKFAGVISVH